LKFQCEVSKTFSLQVGLLTGVVDVMFCLFAKTFIRMRLYGVEGS